MALNPKEKIFFELLASLPEKNNIPLNDIQAIRNAMNSLTPYVDDPEDVNFTDVQMISQSGHAIKLRYYRYDDSTRPIIIFLPGNGFVYELFEANHSIVSKIVSKSACHAVMVDYRLAPEFPYPCALQDVYGALNYIFENEIDFPFDKNRVMLAGYSSGANLAAIITNNLRDNKSMSIYHQILISGAYDYTNSLHDYDDFGLQDKLLTQAEAQFSFDNYCKDVERNDPQCSPYWEKDLSRLPPTTIIVAEYDGGRSQSEAYALKLSKAGNKIKKIILTGQTHGTILYRKALSDGQDPAYVIANEITEIINREK